MALTPTQVRFKSEEIDNGIYVNRRDCTASKEKFISVLNKLIAYPAQFGEYLQTVSDYIPTGIEEELQKDIRAKQIAEFQALQVAVQSVVTSLESITEF